MLIYHVVTPAAWARFKDEPFYEAASLAAEGFIHCSYREQLEGVLGRYYANEEKVFVLSVDPQLLTSRLVAEPSTGGEIYPHVYGPIDRAAIVGAEERVLR